MTMEPMESMNASYDDPYVHSGLLFKEDPPPNGGGGPGAGGDRPAPAEDDPPPNGKPEPSQ